MGGAALLNQIIQTGENGFEAAEKSATPEVKEAIEKGRTDSEKTHEEAVKEFGLPCGEEVNLCNILTQCVVFVELTTCRITIHARY